MNGLTCDMCGNELLIDHDVRYVAEIQVYAAYDPMELTRADLQRDFRKAIKDLIEKMKLMDRETAESSVYKAMCFDLCPPCQRTYLKDPLRAVPTSPGDGSA